MLLHLLILFLFDLVPCVYLFLKFLGCWCTVGLGAIFSCEVISPTRQRQTYYMTLLWTKPLITCGQWLSRLRGILFMLLYWTIPCSTATKPEYGKTLPMVFSWFRIASCFGQPLTDRIMANPVRACVESFTDSSFSKKESRALTSSSSRRLFLHKKI